MIRNLNAAGQFLRFGMVGVMLTLITAAGYWLLSSVAGLDPFVAMTLAYGPAMAIGYIAHGRFTFAGHEGQMSPGQRIVRFLGVNAAGLGLNQLFVWMLVDLAGGPTWWPVIPIVLVTPVATFLLQKRLVFH